MKNSRFKNKLISLMIVLLFTSQAKAQFMSGNMEFNNIHDLKKYQDQLQKQSGRVDKQFGRWYWFTAPRIGPTGIIQEESFTTQKTLNTFLDEQEQSRGNLTHNGYWRFVGGSDYQLTGTSDHSGGVGRVNCITFDPNHANVFYLGTADGGLWKTSNSGQTYNCLTSGMSCISVSAIAVNPQNSDNIFMAIGDADGANTKFREVGIVKTNDGGISWYATSLFWRDPSYFARITQLITHPTHPNIMYASTSEGLFKTTDGWESIDTLFEVTDSWVSRIIWDLKFKPGQPDSVYFCDGRNIMVYKANLQDIDTIYTGFLNLKVNRINLATSENYPDFLYAIQGMQSNSAVAGKGFQGFFLSSNGGKTFRIKSTAPNILGGDTLGNDNRSQAIYDLSIAVKNSDPSKVIIGGINVWASADTGATWTCNSYYRRKTLLNYIHADIHDLEYRNDELYACSDGGLNLSTNDAAGWIELSSGLGINQIYAIAMSAQDINLTYGGLQDNGLNRYKTNETMDQVKAGDELQLVVNYRDADTILFFRQNGRLFCTYDGGETTQFINDFSTSTWECPIIMDPVDPQKIFLGVDKAVKYSYDSFNTYFQHLRTLYYNINVMAQGVNDNNRMYIATDFALYRVENVFSGFDTINISSTLPLSQAEISGIAVDPANADNVWVCFSGFKDGLKVYHTSNKGADWVDVSANLPNVPINCIVYEEGSNNGVYIGTDIGVFYTDDDLGNWIYFTNGLPTTIVTDLKIHSGAQKIRAATYGSGLWESDLYATCKASMLLTANNDPGNPDFTGIQRYEASSTIHSTRIVTGGYGTDVKYQAGDYVTLTPGFEARTGNMFEAKIGPCGTQIRNPVIVPITGRLHYEAKNDK